jgi:hypothetical protein
MNNPTNQTNSNHIVDLNPIFDIFNNLGQESNSGSDSDNEINNQANSNFSTEKDKFIEKHLNSLFFPYYFYMKSLMYDDKIYKKLRKNQKGSDNKELNEINLYFLMEIIKKRIEGIDS